MEYEKTKRRIEEMKELEDYVEDEIIRLNEDIVKAMIVNVPTYIGYLNGYRDALRVIKALISEEGCVMYRAKVEENGETDTSYQ
ncbi:MAG: hypothetical protein OCU22_09330 [Canidatus Methanoxibalbensis ujae]|nr:hypothetical protein [Candidatus Methanoxibalbensis ujae]